MKNTAFKKLLSIDTSIIVIALSMAILSTYYSYQHGYVLAYGDTESHLNIAKRVIDSLTPGLAQLGGIWLPLPHLLMVPFVSIDYLWRTGLAGSIVSGMGYVITGLYIFKLIDLLTDNKFAAYIGFLIFAFNPNILYLQSTAMTEIPLITFFILSSYFFIKFLLDDQNIMALVLAALTGLGASLSRYDGWALVLMEAGIILLKYLLRIYRLLVIKRSRDTSGTAGSSIKSIFSELEGKTFLFSTLAFIGIALWFLWDFLILKDPLYFMNSPFSAKSQQQGWLSRGELPSYRNWYLSFLYYSVTASSNIGILITSLSLIGVLAFLLDTKIKERFYIFLVFSVPFIFYILTLYLGQSVIFIPQLTPKTFQWNIFNVRYGVMMIPVAAFFSGYLISRIYRMFLIPELFKSISKNRKDRSFGKRIRAIFASVFFNASLILVLLAFLLQEYSFLKGTEPVISLEDGVSGLSSAKQTDAQYWLAKNYSGGLVLIDDYARTLSVIRSGIPMNEIIYIGNKPYWEESLIEPQKYATWIIMQKDDTIWKQIYENPDKQGLLYKYFQKVYTSPDILVFKRSDNIAISSVTVDK